jgi:hypothetical protein
LRRSWDKQVRSGFSLPHPGLLWRAHLSVALAGVMNFGFRMLVPAMPVIMGILLRDLRYVRHYRHYVGKFSVHFDALREGPVRHYLSDVFLQVKQVPDTIEGECVQCGNCCLNKRCAFLEPVAEDKYQCGIYGSFMRRMSNCGSFPLHAHDIARYQCPSYFVAPAKPVLWLRVDNPDGGGAG